MSTPASLYQDSPCAYPCLWLAFTVYVYVLVHTCVHAPCLLTEE